MLRRDGGLTIIELPGFGRRRLGAFVFYVLGIPLAMVVGVGTRCVLSLQLMSTSTVAALVARLQRRPLIVMSTTSGSLSELRYIDSTRTASVRRRLLGRADRLLAQTPEGAAALTVLADPHRIAVLPNPVEVPPEPPRLNGLPRALYVGRLSAEKDLGLLLEAWHTVVEVHPDARLSLLGSGGSFRSVEAELRAQVAATRVLRETVAMPGWVDDVSLELGRSDLFVFPSREEGMSNALLEACAWGRLIVASNIPPNLAVLGPEHPYLFPPGDRQAMAEALLAALAATPTERDRVREATLTRVRRQFSLSSVVSRLEQQIDAASRPRN